MGDFIMQNKFKQILFELRKYGWKTDGCRCKRAVHDLLLFVFFFILAIFISNLLSNLHDDNNNFAVSVFILAVTMIARFTQGYLYGVLASILGVFCVNYIFTYPYWEFNMSIAGYPLTFIVMLVVSICISALTTRIKQQEQLRIDMEMEKMRSNLLRSVSHDLRTPLTSIVGSSSVLLENGDLSQQQRDELLREINKDARWLTQITENILSVTKFDSSRVKLRKEDEVVEEIVSSAIVKFKKGGSAVRFVVHKPDDILLIPMDATLIEQVILNLFDNAVVHGKSTDTIWISIETKNAGVQITVKDNGQGIADHLFSHLFDGYASAYNPHPDDRRNMGIGLSVCRSIIRAHGGKIEAYTNECGGASFTFWLPEERYEEYEQS